MAEVKPGDKVCDRCSAYLADALAVMMVGQVSGNALQEEVEVDLCANCQKNVLAVIKRAVKAK